MYVYNLKWECIVWTLCQSVSETDRGCLCCCLGRPRGWVWVDNCWRFGIVCCCSCWPKAKVLYTLHVKIVIMPIIRVCNYSLWSVPFVKKWFLLSTAYLLTFVLQLNQVKLSLHQIVYFLSHTKYFNVTLFTRFLLFPAVRIRKIGGLFF